MSEPLRIVVRGHPAPQGSKRPRAKVTAGGHVKTWTQEQNKVPVDQWRSDVKSAAGDVIDQQACLAGCDCPVSLGACPHWQPLTAPLAVRMVFSFARPASHYGAGRNARALKPSAPARPVTKAGDLDKLMRSTCDALTAAGIWRDDRQVAECGRLAKVWCGEDPDALGVPGAVITVRPIGE